MNKNKIHPKYISKFKQGNILYRIILENKIYAIYYISRVTYNDIKEELDVVLIKLKNSYSINLITIVQLQLDSENIEVWSDFYQEI